MSSSIRDQDTTAPPDVAEGFGGIHLRLCAYGDDGDECDFDLASGGGRAG